MVIELAAHETSLEGYRSWPCRHHRPAGSEVDNRAHHGKSTVLAPTSPPRPCGVTKESVGSSRHSKFISSDRSKDGGDSKSCPSSPNPEVKPKRKRTLEPQVLQAPADRVEKRIAADKGTTPSIYSFVAVGDPSYYFSFHSREPTASCLGYEAVKRGRAFHDVDGPSTNTLSCKKRRLRFHLVTSRLSQPYSLPATHILNRGSDDDTPVLSRFLKLAVVGAKRAGHQAALVRKAAILNRIRIGVRQAAVSRGHMIMAGMAERGNVLSHGLQVVTTSSSSTGAMFPVRSLEDRHQMPPAWRPHTTAFHSTASHSSSPDADVPSKEHTTETPENSRRDAGTEATPETCRPLPASQFVSPEPNMPIQANANASRLIEEDEEVAFPAPDLETRYADLSDDGMDDVYADFGVLFGSGARSPEGGTASCDAGAEEHFFEEYLDELDGIPWIS